jgi:flagellar hook protein FlgE
MLISMSSASGALRDDQTYMDVIANNIANVNTNGYKTSNVTFEDLLSQIESAGSAPTATQGGINPIQIGLGSTLGAVNGIFSQGSMVNTGNSNDLAISGSGFFVFQGDNTQLYSRDGSSLELGLDGSLENPSTGMRLLGWNADPTTGAINTTGALSAIVVPMNQGMAQSTQNVGVTGNIDAALAARSVTSTQTVASTVTGFGTSSTVTNELPSDTYYVEIQGTAGAQQFRVVDSNGNAVSIAGVNGTASTSGWQSVTSEEGQTYDTGRGLTITFGSGTLTDGTLGAGAASVQYVAQGVTASLQVYDSLGAAHTLNLTFTKDTNATNQWSWQVTDSDSTIATLTPATASSLNFTTTGAYAPGTTATSLSLTYNNGAAAQTIALDFSKLTQLSQASDLGVPTQDGYAPGQLTGWNVTSSGQVVGTYGNGATKVLGQLALASFANPDGLIRVGDNMFSPGADSGTATSGVPGTGGLGNVEAGYTESSNVDLATEFSNMISAQRSFEANSKVITSSDQMLQDLVNLIH